MLGYILVAGSGFGIAWWIASTGLAYWRSAVWFLTGFIVSWLVGSLLAALLLRSAELFVDPAFTGKTFWYAVFGAGWGVYQARARLKRRLISASAPNVSSPQSQQSARPVNDAYAEALSEIEEGRVDKGVWARAFADAGGDESKAKALYIRARAEATKHAVVWEDTQPSVADERDANIPAAQAKYGFFRTAGRMYGILSARHLAPGSWLGVGVVVLASMLAVSAYQNYRARQVAVEARNSSQPGEPASPGQEERWKKGATPGGEPLSGSKASQFDPSTARAIGGAPGEFDPSTARPIGENANKTVPETRPLTQADWEKGVITPPSGNRASVGRSQVDDFLSGKSGTGKQPSQIDRFLSSAPGPSGTTPAQPPKAIYKCTGPNGVLYQATPCGTASN